jgi:hypothetical protein
MKKKHLVIALLCLGLVMTLLLAACGSPAPSTGTTPPTSTSSPYIVPTTLSGPPPTVASIASEPASIDIAVNGTSQLRITAVYNNDYKDVVTFKARYSSDNEKAARVSVGGLVTGVGAGSANINVTYTEGKTTVTTTVKVTVK